MCVYSVSPDVPQHCKTEIPLKFKLTTAGVSSTLLELTEHSVFVKAIVEMFNTDELIL